MKDVWKYLYRAVDKEGKIVDFLLTAKRDKTADKRFFEKAMRHNGDPEREGAKFNITLSSALGIEYAKPIK